MFHGTNGAYYHKNLVGRGRPDVYGPESGEVQITTDFGEAFGRALKTAYDYFTGDPLVLVIGTSKLSCKIERTKNGFGYSVPFVDKKAYDILQINNSIDKCRLELEMIIQRLLGSG